MISVIVKERNIFYLLLCEHETWYIFSKFKDLIFYILDTCTFRIGSLELAGNKLHRLTNSLRYSEIRKLNISGNQLQHLTEEDFSLVLKIEELYLRENQIRQINTHTFKTIRNSIKHLDLSFNNIVFINGTVRKMHELITLNLAFNKLQVRRFLYKYFYFEISVFHSNFPIVILSLWP